MSLELSNREMILEDVGVVGTDQGEVRSKKGQ